MLDIAQIYSHITSITLLVLCLALQLGTAIIFWNDLKTNNNRLSNGVLFILNINLGMQVTIPNIIGYFNSYSVENKLNIRQDDLLATTLVHAISLLCFFAAFKYKQILSLARSGVKSRAVATNNKRNANKIETEDKILPMLLAIGYYILWNNFSFSPIQTTSTSDLVIYATTIFEWSSIIASIIIITLYKGQPLLKILAATLFLGFQIYFLSKGLRGGILIFIILFPFYLYIKHGKINFKLVLIGVIAVIPIFPYLGGDFRSQLATTLLNASPAERLESLITGSSSGSDEASLIKNIAASLEKIYQRLEATRNSVSLINLYNNEEGVQLRPTISSLAAFIPTRFWPSKNYPSSSTEDVNGTAMYVVKSETYGFTDMGPFLSSAHDYWEGGIFYTIISAILVGYVWRKLCEWGHRNGYSAISLLVAGSLLDAHHGEISVTSPLALTIKVAFFQTIPLIVFFIATRLVVRLRIVAKKKP